MSASDKDPVTSAAAAVMSALQPLAPDERQRVLDASAALFGLSAPTRNSGSSNDSDDDEGTDGSGEAEVAAARGTGGKRLSIVEFLNTKNPATNAQRLACFAYYREHIEKKGQNFARADLKPYFQSAKLAMPAKYDRDFREAVGASWIHEDGAKSYLTIAGETAVSAGFGGKARPRGSSTSKKRKKNAASGKPA